MRMLVPECLRSPVFGVKRRADVGAAGNLHGQRWWNGNALMCVGVALSHAVVVSAQRLWTTHLPT